MRAQAALRPAISPHTQVGACARRGISVFLRPTRAEAATTATVKASISVQRALISGVTPVFQRVYTLMGGVFTFTPVTNRLMITSSKLMAKLSSMPEAIAGAISGSVMSKNTRASLAQGPAASGRLLSSL